MMTQKQNNRRNYITINIIFWCISTHARKFVTSLTTYFICYSDATRTRTTGRRTTDHRKLAAMRTDREANLTPQQLIAKARDSKKHFAPYASRQLFT